jgi:predicted GNAT family N-acyltransferase
MGSFRIRRADWHRDLPRLRAVREAVFVAEQKVPPELEWDEFDPTSLHVLAESEQGAPIGTGRLLPDGHVGRMAVLRAWRGQGVGDAMLTHLVAAAREAGMTELVLNAQTHAVEFYRRHGFGTDGEPFVEAGIPH